MGHIIITYINFSLKIIIGKIFITLLILPLSYAEAQAQNTKEAYPPSDSKPIEAIEKFTEDTMNAGEETEVEEIAVKLDRSRRLTVPVHIHGNGPYSFVIDTGAERTVLAGLIASKLMLAKAPSATLMTMTGLAPVEMAHIDELSIGGQLYYNLESPLLDRKNIGADGIIGLDSLQGQRVLFDNKKRAIYVGESLSNYSGLTGDEMIISVIAKRKSGQLIFTKASINGVPVRVIIDTGAQASVGNLALLKRLRKRRVIHSSKISLIAVTGDILEADRFIVEDFTLGKLHIPYTSIAFVDAAPFERLNLKKKPAILLGMDILRRLDQFAIDFDRRRLYFSLPKTVKRVRLPQANRRATKIGAERCTLHC